MSGSIKGIIVEIGGDTSGLQKALKNVNSATASLSKELKQVNSLLKLDPKNTELLNQKQSILNETIEETSGKLNILKSSQEQVVKQWQRYKEVEPQLNKINESIEKEKKELEKLEEQQKEVTKAFEKGKVSEEQYNAINEAVKKCKDNISQLKKEEIELSKNTVSTEDFRAYQQETIKTEQSLNRAKKELIDFKNENSKWNKAGDYLTNLGSELDNVSKKIDSLGSKLTTRLTLPITAVATAGISYNAEIEKMTTAFTTFLGDAKEAERVVENIKNNAAKTPFDVTSLVKANQMLISTGENAEDAQETIMALGDAITATGGGNSELERMAANLQQVKNAGKATALDIKQFAYAGIDIYGLLAKSMNKTTQEIKDMDISYEDLTKALKQANKQGGKYYKAMDNASETLTGQVNQLKSEFKDMTGQLTKSLMPVAKKLVSGAKDLINKFDNLSDSQKDNIVKIGLMVAAAGPLLKIGSSAISIVGSVTSGIGTVTKAIGLMHNGIGTATGSAATLAKVFQGLISPAGLAVTAVTALTGAIVYFANKETEAEKKSRELLESLKESNTQFKEFDRSIDESMNTELSQISYVEKLKKELDSLVDENGKVKDGYKDRADFIVNELNNALNTEISIVDDQIQNYKDLSSEIDNLIDKKRASIKLNAKEEKYKYAIQNQEEATKRLEQTLNNLGMSYEEAEATFDDYYAKMQSGDSKAIYELMQSNNVALIESFGYARDEVQKYTDDIKEYEQDYANFTSGKYSEVGKTIKETTKDWTDTSLTEIQNSIKEQEKSLEIYKQIYENTGNEIAKENIEQAQNNIDQLTKELEERKSTIDTLGKEEISTWEKVGIKGFESYLKGLTDDEKKKILKDAGIENVEEVIKGLNEGNLSEEAGINVLKGLQQGLDNQYWKNQIFGKASNLMSKLTGTLSTIGINTSILPGHKNGLDYVPYDNYIARLHKGERVLTAKENQQLIDFEKTSNLAKNTSSLNKTVYTTPNITFNVQKMDKANLDMAFNYINRKFGTQY